MNKAQEAELNARFEALEKIVAEQTEKIEKLEAENEELKENQPKPPAATPPKEKPKIPEEPFTFGGKKYRFKIATFNIPWNGNRERFTAEEAIKRDDVKKYLVENKRWAVIESVK